jgi:hypothetical protein
MKYLYLAHAMQVIPQVKNDVYNRGVTTMFVKKPLALVLGVCATGMLAAQSAQAYVYAGSELSIDELTISIDSGGNPISIEGFGYSTSTSAELNGAAVGDADSCGGQPLNNDCGVAPVLSSDAVNAPGSGGNIRGAGDYSLSGVTSTNYANSNAEITTAELVNFVPSSVQQVSEANLVGNGTASAGTSVQSNTNLFFLFQTGSGSVEITLSFDAFLDQFAEIDNTALLGGPTIDANAQYSSSVTASLTGSGVDASWTSDGVSSNCSSGSAGCDDPSDPSDLTITQSTGAGIAFGIPFGDPSSVSNGTGGPQSYLVTLTADCPIAVCNWTLNLAATTGVVIRNEVPAPASVALMGLGLLGLAGIRRRNKAKA